MPMQKIEGFRGLKGFNSLSPEEYNKWRSLLH